MDRSCLARPYLDSLTTRELVRIADKCGIDIPPSLERVFIIGELLDYAGEEEEDGEQGETLLESPDYPETAPVPRRYNITFIDVMVRDPLWVFAFWEVKEHDRNIFEADPGFSGYRLRVAGNGPAPSFTIQVDPDDTARYLGFSEYPAQPEAGFRVELRAGVGETSEVLAVSRAFRLPRLPGRNDFEASPLSLLSGLNDFPILRDTDRPPYRRFSGP
jgi:hypothetical protein